MKYFENRVKEALRLHEGNERLAKDQIFAWLLEDHKLLLDVTKPHLNGIVSYSMERILNRLSKTDEELLEEVSMDAVYSSSGRDQVGKDILKGFISKNAPKFGQESIAAPLKKKRASKKHEDTMRLLAGKGETNAS